MIVFIFGNPDLAEDSLPLRILPDLRKNFPDIMFEVKDPNEEWEVPENFVAIDTVQGIDEVTVYNDLSVFESAPRVSMHDFDALTQLRWLRKLGKLKSVTIIGVPTDLDEKKVLDSIEKIILRLIAKNGIIN